MLRFILAVILIMWLIGFATHVAGDVIHVLFVLFVLGVAYELLTGRKVSL